MKLFKKSLSVILVFAMIFSMFSVVASAADGEGKNNKVEAVVKFFRADGKGGLVETTRAKPGENLTVRLYLTTDFKTKEMMLAFAFDKNYFEISDANDVPMHNKGINIFDMSKFKITNDPTRNTIIKKLLDKGIISAADIEGKGTVVGSISGKIDAPRIINNEWVISFDAKVANNEYVLNKDNSGTVSLDKKFASTYGKAVHTDFYNYSLPDEDDEYSGIRMYQFEADFTSTPASVGVYSNVTFDAGDGTFGQNKTNALSGVIGSKVGAVSEPTAPEYKKFLGWSKIEGGTTVLTDAELAALEYGYEDATYYAVYRDKTPEELEDVDYKVIKYLPKLNEQGYDEVSEDKSGKEGQTVTVSLNDEAVKVEGFTPVADGSSLSTQLKAGETPDPIEIYYTRNQHNVTYVKEDGTTAVYGPVAVYYGDVIPSYSDYEVPGNTVEFNTTDGAEYTTMPDKDVTFKAELTPIDYYYIFNTADLTSGKTGTFNDGSSDKTSVYHYGDTDITNPAETVGITPPAGYSFEGWDKDIVSPVVGSVTYYAVYEPIGYGVTYQLVNAPAGAVTPVDSAEYIIGDPVVLKAIPAVEGYNVTNWTYNGSTYIPGTEFTMPAENVTFVAEYSAGDYKVKFDANGGSVSETERNVKFGSAVNDLPTPTWAEHDFLGWKDKANPDGGYVTKIDSMPAKNVELVADWAVSTYDVKFVFDGEAPAGTSALPTMDKQAAGANVKLPALPEVPDGYNISGWYAAGTKYEAGSDYTVPSGGVTFVAEIGENEYKITFDLNGVEAECDKEISVKFGESSGTLPVPENKEYNFKGWKDKANLEGGYVTEINPMPAKDIHLEADWEVIKYDVKFEFDGEAPAGTSELPTMDKQAAGANVKLPALPEMPEGYGVDGWYAGGEKYDAGSDFEIPSGGVTFVAKISKGEYHIYFDAGDGTVSETERAVTFGDTVDNLPTPTWNEHEFLGWKDEADLEGGYVTKIDSMPAKDIRLVADWKLTEYDIVYQYTGAVPEGTEALLPAASKSAAGLPITVAEPLTYAGLTFDGWYLNGEKVTNFVMPSSNVTITGKWIVNGGNIYVYALKDTDGNPIGDPIVSKWVNEGEPLELPETVDMTGFDFSGWELIDGSAVPATMPNNDLIIVAKLDAHKFTITYDPANGEAPIVIENVPYGAVDLSIPANPVPPVTEDPSKTENVFAGWFDADGKNVNEYEYMPDNALVFTAKYITKDIAADHTVTYNVDGAVYRSYVVKYGDPVPVPETNPEKFGYKFVGWDSAIPATMPDNDLTFNARWEALPVDGGDGISTGATIAIGGSIIAAVAVATAIGINTALITGACVVGGIIVAVGVAHIIKNSYTVKYIVDGEVYRTFKIIAGTKIIVPKDPKKDGVKFAGWTPEIPSKMPAEDLTFTAKWSDGSGGSRSDVDVDNPPTGSSSTGLAVFGIISAASAAAYVLGKKKKEDEE